MVMPYLEYECFKPLEYGSNVNSLFYLSAENDRGQARLGPNQCPAVEMHRGKRLPFPTRWHLPSTSIRKRYLNNRSPSSAINYQSGT